MDLTKLFEPKSVAIVGASADASKISGMILGFLERSGFRGEILPINPRYEKIRDLTCYPSVDALPKVVDLIVCVVPVAAAFASIESAAHRGVPFCLLMSGGFGEGRTGTKGLERRERLLALCKSTGMHVVGPNTVGMVNFRNKLPLTFADWYGRDTGQRGGVAIVTHSGSIGGLIFSALQLNRIGVDYWFGLGNEATLETSDFISHFSDDPTVHTIICYLEGVRNGRQFIAAASRAIQAGKRIIVINSGRYPETVHSTQSHTAKNPTAGDIYSAAFRQLGIIQVASLAELTYVMILTSRLGERLRNAERIGVISASGGACSVIADHVISAGLQLPRLPDTLQTEINSFLPEYGSSLNPVDTSADVVSRRDLMESTLKALQPDRTVDIWLLFGRPIVDRYHTMITDYAQQFHSAIVVSCGVPLAPDVQQSLENAGIAVLPDPELGVRAIASIARANHRTLFVTQAQPSAASPANDAADISRPFSGRGLRCSEDVSAPLLYVDLLQDSDFGKILSIRWASAVQGRPLRQRMVRVLPLTDRGLEDFLAELTDSPGCPDMNTEQIQALKAAIEVMNESDLSALSVALCSAGGNVSLSVSA